MDGSSPVIDAHVHAGRYGDHFPRAFAEQMMGKTDTPAPEAIDQPIDRLLAEMDAAGVQHAVLLAFDAHRTSGARVPNELVGGIVAEHPDRFTGFASVDPLDPGGLAAFQRAVDEYGLRGLKLAPSYLGIAPDDPAIDPLYALAAERGLPVLVHVGYTPSQSADPRHFAPHPMAAVAERFPEGRFVMAHLGAPWTAHSIALMAQHPNLWADLSIFSWYQPPAIVADALRLAKARGVLPRVMWGSDAPFGPMGASLQRLRDVVAAGMGGEDSLLDTEELASLEGGAAHRLLDLGAARVSGGRDARSDL